MVVPTAGPYWSREVRVDSPDIYGGQWGIPHGCTEKRSSKFRFLGLQGLARICLASTSVRFPISDARDAV
jgi:hypothetical protein